MDQEQYVKDKKSIPISREKRMNPEQPVDENERRQLRAVIGSLQFAAINTRLDLCSRLGQQGQINTAKVTTVLEPNRALQEAKQLSGVKIVIKSIRNNDLRFVAFPVASVGRTRAQNLES